MRLSLKRIFRHFFFALPKRFLFEHRILRNPSRANGTEASRLLNDLIRIKNFSGRYLEIGVERGFTFEGVNLKNKTAVDPAMLFSKTTRNPKIRLFEVASDEFFMKMGDRGDVFDLAYLDGLHTFEQTYRDLENTFRCLSPNSIVLIDDTVPNDIYSANPIQEAAYRDRVKAGFENDGSWHGDTYKVVCTLAYLRLPTIEFRTIIDLQNPKTIIWLNNGSKWPKDLPNLDSIPHSSFTYEEYFTPKVSKLFNPIKRDVLLKELGEISNVNLLVD